MATTLNDDLEELAELRRSFDLRWDCDMRAIKKWQAAAPGRELKWPDHADLCVFLLEQNQELLKALADLTTACATNCEVMNAISLSVYEAACNAEERATVSLNTEQR